MALEATLFGVGIWALKDSGFMSSWDDFPAFVKWMENCKVTAVPAAGIFNSLW